MLIDNPLTGYSPIVALILLGEWVFLAFFLWDLRMSMEMLDALVPRVSLSGCLSGWSLTLDSLNKRKSCLLPLLKLVQMSLQWSRLGILGLGQLGYNKLGFECMALLFARIIAFLSFFGRSIGDSEASIKMTSYSVSLSRSALRPGRATRLSLMSVSSTHLQILYALLSLMP